jgi:flagellar biosynthesis chaperone FliJ
LESLRDEQLRRFTEAYEKMEQKLLDDLAVIQRERQET